MEKFARESTYWQKLWFLVLRVCNHLLFCILVLAKSLVLQTFPSHLQAYLTCHLLLSFLYSCELPNSVELHSALLTLYISDLLSHTLDFCSLHSTIIVVN